MWIWILNALLAGLALGMLLDSHMRQGSLQLVVQRAVYDEPGARVRVWGVRIRSGALA